jgi:ABC-type molybdate transport system substrate-binding protein
MTCTLSRRWRQRTALAVLALAATASAARAADKPEVYSATASLKTAAGASLTAPVTLSITRWTTDAERDKAKAALKDGGSAAFQKAIAAMPEAGVLQLGNVKTPIHFARTLPVSGGKVVTVATTKPVMYVGAGMPDAKPTDKAGYDVAVVIMQVDEAGKGDAGDFSPAAKVKFDETGALVVEDYAAEAVRLMGITRK